MVSPSNHEGQIVKKRKPQRRNDTEKEEKDALAVSCSVMPAYAGIQVFYDRREQVVDTRTSASGRSWA